MEQSPGSALDLTHMLTNSLGNVVNEIMFGFKFPPDDKTWQWLRQIQEEGCHEMGVAGIVNFLPFMRLVLLLFYNLLKSKKNIEFGFFLDFSRLPYRRPCMCLREVKRKLTDSMPVL